MKTEKLDLSERVERRLEIIHAHTKQGKTVRCVIEEFSVSVGTYYYWYHRYEKEGIFAYSILKRVPKPLIIKPATMVHPSSSRLLIAIQS
jgi:transposase-like protein